MNVQNDEYKTIVHIVHGTRPFGILKKSINSTPYWFEEGSPTLSSMVPKENCKTITFKWSGKNSVKARWLAAQSFKEHLKSNIEKYPSAQHVIVAHSHGGTVVANTLSTELASDIKTSHISGIICLGTPFTYIKPVSEKVKTFVLFGVLSFLILIMAIFFYIIYKKTTLFHSSEKQLLGAFIIFACITYNFFAITFNAFEALSYQKSYAYNGSPIITGIPLLLIRATRDEAAIALGVGQLIQTITGFIHNFVLRIYLPRFLIFRFVPVVLVFCLSAVYALQSIETAPKTLVEVQESLIIAMIMTSAIHCLPLLVVFMGRLIIAFIVGDWQFSRWPFTFIEIDAAPPESMCTFFSCSQTESSMRHSIYQETEVQRIIYDTIEKISQ